MPNLELGIHYSPETGQGAGLSREQKESISIEIRPYEQTDCEAVVNLMRTNFNKSFSLFPKDVVDAYKAANRAGDVHSAVKVDGTEAYVAQTSSGEIGGFVLLRYNPFYRREAYGELDLRRLHAHPEMQGQGIGKKLFELVDQRARSKEINVEYITSHASGSSRPYFEANGWQGRTILNDMTKRGTSAIVYVARKRVTLEEIHLYQRPTHVIYAGSSLQKEKSLRAIVGTFDRDIEVQAVASEESDSPDVVEAAKSKAISAASQLAAFGRARPFIVATDIRTDTFAFHNGKYMLINHGKPNAENPLEEIRDNFRQMRDTARTIKRPVPYIVRSATYLLDPSEPNPAEDPYTEYDISVWISQEALEQLSTEEGLRKYREELLETHGADIVNMSAGFALPFFLAHGYVEGINGHPLATLPRKEAIIEKAIQTVLSGMDEKLIKKRLGILTS